MQLVAHLILKNGHAYIAHKPHLKAEMVARMVVDGDATVEQVAEHYGLTIGEVHAALAYYYDNQAELDSVHTQITEEIRENAMTLERFRAKLANKPTKSNLTT